MQTVEGGLKKKIKKKEAEGRGLTPAHKARIDQAIATQESSTLTYKITNVIGFYRSTFHRLLGDESNVLETIKRYGLPPAPVLGKALTILAWKRLLFGSSTASCKTTFDRSIPIFLKRPRASRRLLSSSTP